jgi:hypothetical protein
VLTRLAKVKSDFHKVLTVISIIRTSSKTLKHTCMRRFLFILLSKIKELKWIIMEAYYHAYQTWETKLQFYLRILVAIKINNCSISSISNHFVDHILEMFKVPDKIKKPSHRQEELNILVNKTNTHNKKHLVKVLLKINNKTIIIQKVSYLLKWLLVIKHLWLSTIFKFIQVRTGKDWEVIIIKTTLVEPALLIAIMIL